MTSESTGFSSSAAQTVIFGNQRFVILPERDYQRLLAAAESGEPALPARDKRGNYPAADALKVSIARSVARSRRECGLTQAELARRAAIRPDTLKRIELGRHSPSVATLERLERVFDAARCSPGDRKKSRE